MEGNPYIEMIKILEEEGQRNQTEWYRIGKVTSVFPLKIAVGNIEYQEEELIHTGFSPEKGQDILLIPYDDDQRMIVLCKVVGL